MCQSVSLVRACARRREFRKVGAIISQPIPFAFKHAIVKRSFASSYSRTKLCIWYLPEHPAVTSFAFVRKKQRFIGARNGNRSGRCQNTWELFAVRYCKSQTAGTPRPTAFMSRRPPTTASLRWINFMWGVLRMCGPKAILVEPEYEHTARGRRRSATPPYV